MIFFRFPHNINNPTPLLVKKKKKKKKKKRVIKKKRKRKKKRSEGNDAISKKHTCSKDLIFNLLAFFVFNKMYTV